MVVRASYINRELLLGQLIEASIDNPCLRVDTCFNGVIVVVVTASSSAL